jgi:hypothetical protein
MGAAVNVHEYTPVCTLDEPPSGAPVTLAQRREALADALRGVPLGRFDEDLIGVVVELLPNEAVARGLVSLIERRANAAKMDAWYATPSPNPRPILNTNAPPYADGNTGPGFDR